MITCQAAVIGGGPAGLMAAEVLATAGAHVTIFDAKPTMGRKFLMAGKSGLNLTNTADLNGLLKAIKAPGMRPILQAFDTAAIQIWAKDLGQDLFVGSTGRVFPKAMKASPLLRAWMARLDGLGVDRHVRWRWTGFADEALAFETPEGRKDVRAKVVVFALGGASWARLGSDGQWAPQFPHVPFAPSNSGLSVTWSAHMARHFGAPLKAIAWHAGDATTRGEAVISKTGLEGGGIYALTPALRSGAELWLDLLPDLDLAAVTKRLAQPRGKASLANHMRKRLGLDPAKQALLQEWARPLPTDPTGLAGLLKHLPVRHDGFRPLDEAISTAGGIPLSALNGDLMLQDRPGMFCAGEMLDWDAPTGGYLLTACLATGHWAGHAAVKRLGLA